MGIILGTVAGWQRSPDWSIDNRVYEGVGYEKVYMTRKEKRYEYRAVVNITIYLCDSPCSYPSDLVVTRIIEDIEIIGIRNIRYSGGLDKFVEDKSIKEAEELASRSLIEVAGLCECSVPYNIDVVSSDLLVFYKYKELEEEAEEIPKKRLVTAKRIPISV